MTNNYEVPEVHEMGRAQDVILGTNKLWPFYPDSPGEPEREQMTDDE
jgi:hypothetical protein